MFKKIISRQVASFSFFMVKDQTRSRKTIHMLIMIKGNFSKSRNHNLYLLCVFVWVWGEGWGWDGLVIFNFVSYRFLPFITKCRRGVNTCLYTLLYVNYKIKRLLRVKMRSPDPLMGLRACY